MTDDAKQKLLARLDTLKPDTQRKWGTMSPTEMLAHMNDAYRIALGMKPIRDKSNFITRLVFYIGVYIMPKWPANSNTAHEMKQGKGGSAPRDFYTELEFLKKMMDVFEERETSKMHPHPMFGKLSKKEWSDLFEKHLEHHFRQFGI